MASITASGIGSNLDVNSIVSQLMTIEQQPLTALDRKEASYQAQLSAYGSLRSALSGFRDASNTLAQAATFSSWLAAPSDATLYNAKATSGASIGSHTVEVKTLAQSQRLRSGTYPATSDTLGSGTLTIEFGSYAAGAFTANAERGTRTITIPASAQSLAGVRDAINAAKAGVTASIVNDGTGNRLVLASNETGASSAMRVSVADDDGNHADAAGLSALAYNAATGGTSNMVEAVAARNAEAVIDGIAISKASNTIADALEGVTLTLTKANAGVTTTLAVTRDTSAARSGIQKFVDSYNQLGATLRQISGYDAASKQAGVLQGDATVRAIQSQLRSAVTASLGEAGGSLATLSSVGISFGRDGKLSLDATKLQAAFDDPSKNVAALFASVGTPTDSLVKFVSATATAREGQLALDVSRTATRGAATGSVAAATAITTGVNDTLTVDVDGTAVTVQLAAGTYTGATLAAALQSRVNGALASAGPLVTVTQNAGVLTVQSNRYGAASTVAITGGNGAADLFGTATSAAGLDAAGTLGGAVATGSARDLTANGITVRIEGGGTGDRGRVDFARGFGARLTTLIDSLLETKGTIASRTDGINRSIDDIGDRRDALERRLTEIEKRYRAQFSALDTMMSSMNQTSTYLTQQLAALQKATSA
jgi:flagellar hook-associated protein 2